MKIKSTRSIAVFDIDGVIIENPPEAQVIGAAPIQDKDYWTRHWSHPELAKFNQEMIDLGKSLLDAQWHIVFLTARPVSFWKDTERLLEIAGFTISGFANIAQTSMHPKLVMLPDDGIPYSSAAWKQDTIRGMIAAGGVVRLMVEDFKHNADAVRAVVPVLLYERKKISNNIVMLPCCGGMSRCWCLPEVPIVAIR